jgi:hypothetical protein
MVAIKEAVLINKEIGNSQQIANETLIQQQLILIRE